MTRRETMHSELSQDEKRATLANDQRVREGGTYYDFAASEAGAVGGRYGAISKTQVSGTGPVPRFPKQPEKSPWARDPVPDEPPFPIDIGPAPVVGEVFEIERSLGEAYSDDVGLLLPKIADSASPGDAPRSDTGFVPPASSEVAPSLPQSRRKSRRR